jgi:hypothetical protein
LIERQIRLRRNNRCVRILNERRGQFAMHTRIEVGKFNRSLGQANLAAPDLSSCRYCKSAPLLGRLGDGARAGRFECEAAILKQAQSHRVH